MRISLPEQVWLDLRVAGFGSRALAYVTDFLLRWTVVGVLIITVLYLITGFSPADGFVGEFVSSLFDDVEAESLGTHVLALIGAFIFAVEWSYPVYFEVARQGVTPGKRMFGLRVVDENGLPITFQASALRTLLLIVDMLPALGFVGLVSMMLSSRSQRLGDLVAKTVVIYDAEREDAGLHGRADTTAQRIELPVRHYALLQKFLSRRNELEAASRRETAKDLRAALQPFIPPDLSGDNESVLERVFLRAEPIRASSGSVTK